MSKLNKISPECKVCSAPAVHHNYGAVVCDACKIFFRRNAENTKKALKCDFDDHCEINILSRHVCTACRLKKCLKVGMSADLIRRNTTKKVNKDIRSTTEANNSLQQIRVTNLLERDHSLLTNDQWTLLSNLIHSYDEHTALPDAQNYMKELESLPPKLRFKIDPKKIVEIASAFYQATEPFIKSNQDFNSLPFHDRSIVLHGAIDNVCCLGSGFLVRQSGLITNSAFRRGLEITYGTIPYNLTLIVISLLDQDINLVKLTLSLFAFCTSSCTLFSQDSSTLYLTDNRSILRIQDMYVELIWKYLLYKYTFNETVVRFSQLVRCIIAALTVRTHLQTVKNHRDVVDELIEKIDQQNINTINN